MVFDKKLPVVAFLAGHESDLQLVAGAREDVGLSLRPRAPTHRLGLEAACVALLEDGVHVAVVAAWGGGRGRRGVGALAAEVVQRHIDPLPFRNLQDGDNGEITRANCEREGMDGRWLGWRYG